MIEKSGANINAYECKWQETVEAPNSFKTAYPDAIFKSITIKNIAD